VPTPARIRTPKSGTSCVNEPPHPPEPPRPEEGLSFWQIVGSTIAAAIGVQKKSNKERDFSRGRPLPFILAGIIFTALFVLAVIAVVHVVLRNVGA
jgi:hypothetical protein